jgi:hypothetical protein
MSCLLYDHFLALFLNSFAFANACKIMQQQYNHFLSSPGRGYTAMFSPVVLVFFLGDYWFLSSSC